MKYNEWSTKKMENKCLLFTCPTLRRLQGAGEVFPGFAPSQWKI